MNDKTVSHLTALSKGFTIEFMRSRTSGLGREIRAFISTIGGAIPISVADDGVDCGLFRGQTVWPTIDPQRAPTNTKEFHD